MISSVHRFHGRSSLRFVYHRGQTVRGQLLSLRYVYNSREQTYRAAVVVSRKVSKSAVVRNRARRRIYEAVRKHERRITKPYDLVFTVYDEKVAIIEPTELQNMIVGQLEKAGVFDDTVPTEANRGILDEKETNI